MTDTTIKKVTADHAPLGKIGQRYLVSGKSVSMRMWERMPRDIAKSNTTRVYETVGYVIDGKAELEVEGQKIQLSPGDSWLVPAGAAHRYKILTPFTAVEATAPPAQVHGRD